MTACACACAIRALNMTDITIIDINDYENVLTLREQQNPHNLCIYYNTKTMTITEKSFNCVL